jgi:hypothetical protein
LQRSDALKESGWIKEQETTICNTTTKEKETIVCHWDCRQWENEQPKESSPQPQNNSNRPNELKAEDKDKTPIRTRALESVCTWSTEKIKKDKKAER